MHTRTPLLALLLAACTAMPAHALDVHIANTSKSEILSVFLAGLTDDPTPYPRGTSDYSEGIAPVRKGLPHREYSVQHS